MLMVADSMPGLKRWLAPAGLSGGARLLASRMIVAFLLHAGRMSCLNAGGAIRSEARHRAQVSRFLARPRWRELDVDSALRRGLLEREADPFDKRRAFLKMSAHGAQAMHRYVAAVREAKLPFV